MYVCHVCPERAPYVFILVYVYPPERGLNVFTLVSVCLSDPSRPWADIYMHYACSNEGRQTLRLNIFVCDQNCGFWAQGPPFSKIGSKIARVQNF